MAAAERKSGDIVVNFDIRAIASRSLTHTRLQQS
jgi:hypothetical protein